VAPGTAARPLDRQALASVLMRVIIEGRGVRGAALRARQGEPDLTGLKRGIARTAVRRTTLAALA
jgi:hypothetical protein